MPAYQTQGTLEPHPLVRNVIAVGSGKGGVGKSTTTVNLALSLRDLGLRVGVLDADIYGPSVPMLLGVSHAPQSPDGQRIEPLRAYDIEFMSIGLMVDRASPVIWRGPMATSALVKLFTDTSWSDLDVLLVDLPPGTGDIQLTLAQKIPVAGALIVTTPQDVATMDAGRALRMFETVGIPVLGIVENMAVHLCANCGHAEHVFGTGGGQQMSMSFDVPVLAALPLDVRIRQQADVGVPIVQNAPTSPATALYRQVAVGLIQELQKRPRARRISATIVP